MSHPGAGSALQNVFYAIGYALGEAEGLLDGAEAGGREAEPVPTSAADSAAGTGPRHAAVEPTTWPDAPGAVAGAALGAAAAAWLLARLFTPRPVRWPRALLAGLAGSACAAAAEFVERRLGTVPPDTPAMDGPVRLTAGIAAAAAYASLLYPRLPGAPGTRGLIFGAIEAAATQAGGTFTLLRRLSPQIAVPFEALAPAIVPARGPISAVAFGLGLGLYRDGDR